jgi:hypothetical protein
MKTLLLVAVASLALASTFPALAAGGPAKPTAGDHSLYRLTCRGLETEFDKAEPYGRMEPKLPSAEYLRGVGGTLCLEGHYADGIATLRNALAAVRIHPLTQTDPLEDRAG